MSGGKGARGAGWGLGGGDVTEKVTEVFSFCINAFLSVLLMFLLLINAMHLTHCDLCPLGGSLCFALVCFVFWFFFFVCVFNFFLHFFWNAHWVMDGPRSH